MPANPYAKFLGDRAARDVIRTTGGRLHDLLEALGPQSAGVSPAPGKWSAREILCHLADCEIVFGYRLRQALAEDAHVIQPFDQDRWAAAYAAIDAHSALAVFTTVRHWNLRLIEGLSAAQLARRLSHPERGDMTVEVVVETMAGHDLNHLQQIDAIAGKL